eukprot:m.61641 g.61641  ORF g.61641 m.61641 type:complete len:239 (+) comp49481_c0_seq4:171-887(+)
MQTYGASVAERLLQRCEQMPATHPALPTFVADAGVLVEQVPASHPLAEELRGRLQALHRTVNIQPQVGRDSLASLLSASPVLDKTPAKPALDKPDSAPLQHQEQDAGLRRRTFKSNADRKSELLAQQQAESAQASTSKLTLDEQLLRDQAIQNQLISDMLGMTQALKQQTIHANRVIKHDIETLEETDKLAAQAAQNLEQATTMIKEQLAAAGGWRVWIMLIGSALVFIFMILFMKIT